MISFQQAITLLAVKTSAGRGRRTTAMSARGFGFAYRLTPKTVIRGGYGIYYTENPYNNEQFELTYPPNFINQGYSYTIGQQAPIQQVFAPAPAPGNRGYTNSLVMKDTSAQEWNFTIQRALLEQHDSHRRLRG